MNFRKHFIESHGLAIIGFFIAILGFSGANGLGFTADYLEGLPGVIMGSFGVGLIVANIIYLQMPVNDSSESHDKKPRP